MQEQEEVAQQGADQDAPTDTTVPVVIYGALSVLDPIEAVLVDAERKFKDVAYNLTTTKGYKEARSARQELVKIRTGAKSAYEKWNKPVLEQQRIAREKVTEITTRVKPLEENIDLQIKADEARREEERRERERVEAERVAKIRERITNIANVPMLAIEMDADEIEAVIDDLRAMPLSEERFAEFLDEATNLVGTIVEKLVGMLGSARAREESVRLAQEQMRQLEAQRLELAAQAEQLAKDRAAQAEEARRMQILREEQERAAADKAFRDAEDARRAAAGQSDAFAKEKQEALQVVREDAAERRAEQQVQPTTHYARHQAARPVSTQPPQEAEAAAVVPATIPDFDAINAAAADASTQVRGDDVADSVVPAYAEDKEPWAPSARFVVDLLADATNGDANESLRWLQAIDFQGLTTESLRDGQ